MKLKLKIYNCLCSTELFEINDIEADKEDFGNQFDHDEVNAEPYCCANMQFDRIESTPQILKKYGITQDEYNEICDKLEEGLSFGNCGMCE